MENELIKGNVLKSLVKFAIPVLAAMFLQSLYGGVDLLVVGQFAETVDVSGVSTGSILTQTITMVVTGLAMGITVHVGQKIGENNPEEAGKAIGTGVVLFGIIAIIITLGMTVFTETLANLLHTPQEAFVQTCEYIRVCGFGMIFVVFYNLLGAIFRGIGDSKTPLLTVCIACVANIFGDLLFICIFGLGAMGAALATVIAQAISVIVSMMIVSKKQLPFEFHRSMIRLNGSIVKKELQLGTPIAFQELLVGISFIVIQTVVNSMGVVTSAGVGVAEKVCAFIMLVPSAFSQSISAFVAQNIGAGEKERAKKALKCGILSALAVSSFISVFTFIRGDLLAGIFSKETDVIAQAHLYLKAYAIDTIFTSIMFSFVGYFNGIGKTFFVMVQGLVGAVLVRIPIVILVSKMSMATLFHIGLATPSATIVQIIMCVLYYKGVMIKSIKKEVK